MEAVQEVSFSDEKGVDGYQIERSLRFNDPDEAYLS